jgi:uncharacterized phiE125 gp8 family phage protein
MPLKLITSPVAEPITLAEAKLHLRVDVSDDDALIGALITSARQAAEHEIGRALMLQTLELSLDSFSQETGNQCDRHTYRIVLPRPPLASVAPVVSVKYLDTVGVLQTLDPSAYVIDDHSEPARLMPAYGTSWPSVRCQPNAVLIRYQAGYATAADVPAAIKSWMLLQIGAMYENREAVAAGMTVMALPFVDRLLDPYRVWGA